MTDDELRALVRAAVARHLGVGRAEPPAPESPRPALRETPPGSPRHAGHDTHGHVSHAMYLALVNPGDACMIEPAVPCNHCGYCKSHGH